MSYEFIRLGKIDWCAQSFVQFVFSFQQSLNDMKWKCFRRSLNYRLEPNHYKDPVLIAYWNALRADTLCAWRRVLTDDGQKTEKELWLFSINEDLPSELPNLRRKN